MEQEGTQRSVCASGKCGGGTMKACPSGFRLLVVSVFSVKFDIGMGRGLGNMGSLKKFAKNIDC